MCHKAVPSPELWAYTTLFMSAGLASLACEKLGFSWPKRGAVKVEANLQKGPLKLVRTGLQLFIFNRMLQLQKQFKINLLVKWSGIQARVPYRIPQPAPFWPFACPSHPNRTAVVVSLVFGPTAEATTGTGIVTAAFSTSAFNIKYSFTALRALEVTR